MLWSSVPQLRWHVARQVLQSYLWLVLLAATFWYQPQIVQYAHGLLFSRGFVPAEVEANMLAKYFEYGWWSLAIAFVTLEVGGFFTKWRFKAKPDQYPAFQERLRLLAEEAGIRTPTLIVMPGKIVGRILNAAATQSILSGPKVIVMGNIVETLTDEEETYVTAHEVKHLAHWDIFPLLFIGAGNGAIGIQKYVLMTSTVYSFLTFEWRAAVFLFTAWLVMSVTHTGYKLLMAAHSRAREYLADVGAVKLAGWRGRVHLILGLTRIHHAMTGSHPFKLVEWISWIFHSHPTVEHRAEALELPVEVLDRRTVQVGGVDVVIA